MLSLASERLQAAPNSMVFCAALGGAFGQSSCVEAITCPHPAAMVRCAGSTKTLKGDTRERERERAPEPETETDTAKQRSLMSKFMDSLSVRNGKRCNRLEQEPPKLAGIAEAQQFTTVKIERPARVI